MKKTLFLILTSIFTWSVAEADKFTDFGTEYGMWKGDFAVGDIDDNGTLDIIFSGEENGVEKGGVFLNDGNGNFTPQPGERLARLGCAGNIKFGDIDGDGDLDIIFCGWGSGSNANSKGIALNDGNGNFTLADSGKYPILNADKVTSCGFADFNADGLLDYYFFGNYTIDDADNITGNCVIYLQNQDGTFTARPDLFPTFQLNEPEVTIVDFDKDGFPDIWVNASDESKNCDNSTQDGESQRFSALFINDGSGSFHTYKTCAPTVTEFQNPVFEPDLADPTFVRADNGIFYAYGTENTWPDGHHVVPIIKSQDLVNWTYVGDAFKNKPSWGTADAGVWAPQIVKKADGTYCLYYSLSTWGDENPGIGVATANTPEGPFMDKGKIFDSNESGVANGIDPFFIATDNGQYLFWGSFNGIYCVEMSDYKTPDWSTKTKIANKHFEAAYIYPHDGKFYFFGSVGSCCEGADSEYHVNIARADNITGPYKDKDGNDISEEDSWLDSLLGNTNSGSPFLSGDRDLGWVGPGHNAEIIQDDNGHYYMLYHAVDINEPYLPGDATRRPLMLSEITWVDGWPVINYGTDYEGKPGVGLATAPYFEAADMGNIGLAFPKSNGTSSWADVDGDGYMDLLHNGDGALCSGETNNRVNRIYKNMDGNKLQEMFSTEIGRTGHFGNGTAWVDWNGDGKLDFFSGGWDDVSGKQVLTLYLGDDPTNFTFTKSTLSSDIPGVSEQGLRIADLNNDARPDLLECGFGSINRRVAGWVQNTTAPVAEVLPTPTGLQMAYVSFNPVGIRFRWNLPASLTGKPGLTYNLALRNVTTGKWLYNPMANLETGWRKVGGREGNVFTNKEYRVYNLPDGRYEWTVQVIDGSYLGGKFAEVQTFTIGTPTSHCATQDFQPVINIRDKKLEIIGVPAAKHTANVYAISGQLCQTETFNERTTMELPACGVYIVEISNSLGGVARRKIIVQ